MIDWIRDAETGELLPIENDFNFEPPAHLDIPEYTTIDYDKTTKMTIEELQNQLIAAQNYIEAIENEKTSDNNSAVTVNEDSPDIVSKSGFMDFWYEFYPIIILIVVCLAVFSFGIFVFKDEIIQGLSNSQISEQKSVDYELTIVPEIGSIPIYSSEQGTALYLNPKEQEQLQEQHETEQEQSEINVLQKYLNFALRFLPLIITIIGLKLGISFLMNVMRGP